MDLNIGFQGLALIQGQIYNPNCDCRASGRTSGWRRASSRGASTYLWRNGSVSSSGFDTHLLALVKCFFLGLRRKRPDLKKRWENHGKQRSLYYITNFCLKMRFHIQVVLISLYNLVLNDPDDDGWSTVPRWRSFQVKLFFSFKSQVWMSWKLRWNPKLGSSNGFLRRKRWM